MTSLGDPDRRLRDRAEEKLRARDGGGTPAAGDPNALRYELEVHQVELQMQNETLREACAELELSRDRYRNLFARAPVAYFSLDAEARIHDCNETAATLLGEPVDRLRNQKRLSSFVADEHAELFEHHRRDVLAGNERRSCTLAVTDARGKRREVRVESVPGREREALWFCTMVDVTELQRLQRRLQEAQKLEGMSTLASGVAHEFNNILMAILGFADMALTQLPPGGAGRTPVEQLQQAVVRGRSVVDQLMAFAHGGEGRTQTIDLDALVQNSEPLLRQILGDDVAIELQLRAEGAMVRIDPGQCQQILLNLARNARAAMSKGGVFRIETRCAASGALSAAAHAELGFRPCVLLKVSDTGAGMSPETRARAFEPFFTTKAPGVGTGLGLSMVYGAVRKADGHIEVESRLGAGTGFDIYWPQVLDVRPQAPRRRPPLSRAGSQRALVVDDDQLVRIAIRHYLEREGYAVSDAGSAEEALALLRTPGQSGVQLLVIDVALPGLKGMQLAGEVRALRPQVAVLFISAYAPDVLTESGWFEPALPLLHKPFTAEELQDAISDALATQDWEHDG